MTALRNKRLVASAMLFGSLALSQLAFAEDAATTAAARATGYEGAQAYEQGDFITAADKLGRAFEVAKVPTLGLWHARALEKCGRLVEAAARYTETIEVPVKTGKIKEQKQAQAEAADELAKLRPRIPTLTIIAKGSTDGVELTIDDIVLPITLLGSKHPTNPGVHQVKATRGDRVLHKDITLTEGEKQSLELDLTGLDSPPATPASLPVPVVAPQPGPTATSVALARPAEPRKVQKTVAWVVLGVGGVATITGMITGLMVKSKKDQLDASGDCEGTECFATQRDLRESYNSLRTVSTVSFVIGAVGLGAGTALLVTTPKPKEKSQTTAWIGLGAVGVKGSF